MVNDLMHIIALKEIQLFNLEKENNKLIEDNKKLLERMCIREVENQQLKEKINGIDKLSNNLLYASLYNRIIAIINR
jgi:hypothetical protein